MKKNIILLFIISVTALFISSCDNNSTNPNPVEQKGSIFLQSTPSHAEIWLDGLNTYLTTSDSVTNVTTGDHNITLKLANYFDTTITVNVETGLQTSKQITLTSNLVTVEYGPVTLWETIGTDSTQPSGLVLSTGHAYGVSSTNNDSVDIYYSSDGFVVKSADLYPNLTRNTSFFIGSGAVLDDSVNSPQISSSWTDRVPDSESNYVFLYDNDQHYSKLKITAMGGGTPNNPAWIEVQWIYNKTANDVRF